MKITDWKVESIKAKETYDWLINKHYAHRIPSISYSFGLYDKETILQGVCTFGKPASPFLCVGVCGPKNSEFVYELNRLVTNEGLPKNATSYLVSLSLKLLNGKKIIVSYADEGMGHYGYIYQATNWLYTGRTVERTDIDSGEGKHSRHYDKTIDYKNNRKYRSAKHRYVYFIGTKRDKKDFMQQLNYSIQPYPKGVVKRYDASYNPKVQMVLDFQ